MASRTGFILRKLCQTGLQYGRRPSPQMLFCAASFSTTAPITVSPTEIHLTYENGLPRFQIPLPSRQETCVFTMKPLSNTVGDLIRNIREEDRGVDRVAIYAKDRSRIAQSNSIETLLTNDFDIQINDHVYTVDVPPYLSENQETIDRLSDLKNVISQLHMGLNIEEYQLKKERELKQKLQELQFELEPLEKERLVLAERAAKRTRALTWFGLGSMGLQFGLLARLTWWEYSWDIMEPVTYFVGYGTAIIMYGYYVTTRQEYTFPHVFDREYLKKFYKEAHKTNFDVDRYNNVQEAISEVESDIRRLRDPLLLNLPLQQIKDLPEKEF